MGLSQFDENKFVIWNLPYGSAFGTNVELLAGEDADTERVDVVLASNNDTIDHVVQFFIVHSGTTTAMGAVNVPAGAGFASAAIDVIAALLPVAQPFVMVDLHTHLDVAPVIAVTDPFELDFTAWGGRIP